MKEERIYGRNAVLEALRAGDVKRLYVKKDAKDGSMRPILALAKERGIIVSQVSREKLDALAEGAVHQGVCAYVNDFQYTPFEDLLKGDFLLLLDGIEDPHNLGAIIRSAHQAGAQGVVIPKRRAASVTSTVMKTSAGALRYTPVSQVTNLTQTVDRLKEAGFWIFGAAMEGTDYDKMDLSGKVALVIGNEEKGIGPGLMKHLDGMITIPMVGKIDSLNASCAAAILAFEVARQRRG